MGHQPAACLSYYLAKISLEPEVLTPSRALQADASARLGVMAAALRVGVFFAAAFEQRRLSPTPPALAPRRRTRLRRLRSRKQRPCTHGTVIVPRWHAQVRRSLIRITVSHQILRGPASGAHGTARRFRSNPGRESRDRPKPVTREGTEYSEGVRLFPRSRAAPTWRRSRGNITINEDTISSIRRPARLP